MPSPKVTAAAAAAKDADALSDAASTASAGPADLLNGFADFADAVTQILTSPPHAPSWSDAKRLRTANAKIKAAVSEAVQTIMSAGEIAELEV